MVLTVPRDLSCLRWLHKSSNCPPTEEGPSLLQMYVTTMKSISFLQGVLHGCEFVFTLNSLEFSTWPSMRCACLFSLFWQRLLTRVGNTIQEEASECVIRQCWRIPCLKLDSGELKCSVSVGWTPPTSVHVDPSRAALTPLSHPPTTTRYTVQRQPLSGPILPVRPWLNVWVTPL